MMAAWRCNVIVYFFVVQEDDGENWGSICLSHTQGGARRTGSPDILIGGVL